MPKTIDEEKEILNLKLDQDDRTETRTRKTEVCKMIKEYTIKDIEASDFSPLIKERLKRNRIAYLFKKAAEVKEWVVIQKKSQRCLTTT